MNFLIWSSGHMSQGQQKLASAPNHINITIEIRLGENLVLRPITACVSLLI